MPSMVWDQGAVANALAPFVRIAETVPTNRRKVYVSAGGGRRKNLQDPSSRSIDSYAGIKTPHVNAVFVCEIRNRGDDPTFILKIGDNPRRNPRPCQTYSLDQLPQALVEWQSIARLAISGPRGA